MPITVIVWSGVDNARLTFDGIQRVVIGRGASCDVRLPDASVSHRHALLRTQGSDVVVIDEGSTNGTYVGGARVAPHTSRIVRSGDTVRVGRVWLELRIDQSPITRDVAGTTRDLALAMVSRALARHGDDMAPRVRVVEGADQGLSTGLGDPDRAYVLGRGPHCDLLLSDADASREHAVVSRRAGGIYVRDLGAKNGTWLASAPVPTDRDIPWRPSQMLQIGRTVVALEEPLTSALARIESEPDERLGPDEAIAPLLRDSVQPAAGAGNAAEEGPVTPRPPAREPRSRPGTSLSIADRVVIVAALGVLVLSVVGLFWLLH